jgi:hypothetical protein
VAPLPQSFRYAAGWMSNRQQQTGSSDFLSLCQPTGIQIDEYHGRIFIQAV